jgi:hypothetical protein
VKASAGDRIIIEGHREGEPLRDGEIIEVRSDDGSPPYVVEWSDNGHTSLFYPGRDARVQHFQHPGSHGSERAPA